MALFLTFTLMAPLASFGTIAVGERRASDDRPAKSAVLGFVAGALGIDRAADDHHAALARDYGCAVRTEDMHVRAPHRLMTDYHTAQTRARGRNQHFATRRDELADKRELGTILSWREYRGDCSYTIALWVRAEAPIYSLAALRDALQKPAFVPYAGRKSCPLMLPAMPRLIEAVSLSEAFRQRDRQSDEQRVFLETYRLASRPVGLAYDIGAPGENSEGTRHEWRRDATLARSRWQFGVREEIVTRWREKEMGEVDVPERREL